MKIVPFKIEYLEEMAELFVKEYSEPMDEWNLETAKKYLSANFEFYPDYNFSVLTDEGDLAGAIFCKLKDYYRGKVLVVDSLQTKPQYRRKGIAKMLFSKVMETAKNKGIERVHLLTDGRPDFPKKWYLDLGFTPTHWVELEADITEDLINQLKEK